MGRLPGCVQSKRLSLNLRTDEHHFGQLTLGQEFVVFVHQHPTAVVFRAEIVNVRLLYGDACQAFTGVEMDGIEQNHDKLGEFSLKEGLFLETYLSTS